MSDASYDPNQYGLLGPVAPRLALLGLLGDQSGSQTPPAVDAGGSAAAAQPTAAAPATPQAPSSSHGFFGGLKDAARSWWEHASQPDPVTGMTLGDKLRLLGADFRDFGEGTSTAPQVYQDINASVMERARLAMLRRQQAAFATFGNAAGVPGYGGAQGSTTPGVPGLPAPPPPAPGAVLASAGMGGAPQVPTTPPGLPTAPSVPMAALRRGSPVPSLRQMYPSLAALYASGVDISPMVDVLKNAQPEIENVNGWGMDKRDPSNAGRFFGAAPVSGAEPVFDQNGQHVGWHMADGAIQSLADVEAAKAGAEAKAKAPYDFHMVKYASGREIPVSGARLAQNEQGGGTYAPPAAAGGGGQGAPAGDGLGQSTADAEFDKASAGALSQRIEADTGARESALSAAQQAAQALDFVKTHPMNPATPHAADFGNNLRALQQVAPWAHAVLPQDVKGLETAATDAATYQRLATQAQLEGAKTLLPTRYTERELAMLSHIYPGLTSPNDSAALFWAQYGAMANRKKAQADFAANYNGPKNVGAYSKAWAESPDGQRSIFQDPIWNGVTVNGRPAVAYAEKKGVRYGAFMPFNKDGTPNPNAYVFRVR